MWKLPRANEAAERSAHARLSHSELSGSSEPNPLFSKAQEWEALKTDPSRCPMGSSPS